MKTIINFCPTGMVPTKDMNIHVPVSVQEIIEQTHAAWEIGITIAHLHARLEDGSPTYLSSVYRDIFEGVRKHCPGLIVCGSSSGRNWPEFEKRSEVIELFPDMCSLTPSSLNFMTQASVNPPDMVQQLAMKMKDYGVVPELEIFDLGMINYAKYLISKGMVEGPFYWNLLFGNIAGLQANLHSISAAICEIPADHQVVLAGLGQEQLPVTSLAIALGYGVRIGLEDNLWWDQKKRVQADNLSLLKRIHQLLEIHEKDCMSGEELGSMGYYNKKRPTVS
ncbi:MAG: 3-keto-5-aminohexanoate cleavage protein [Saprospiraceae bacterium]|nr:3-keto-5-aminohexanoate cleavage protein [Saprospiraceae bacterium]